MLRYTLIVWLLLLLTGFATTVEADRGLQRIEGAVPEDIRRQENFDAADSAGLFVGVRNFADARFAEVPYAVDDAVDLAYLFAVELSLMTPERVTLALAGEPQKPASQTRLQALIEAGARLRSAGWLDIHDHLTESREATGPRGVFVLTLATHGFSDDGQDYLVGADSRRRFIKRSGIGVAEVLDEIAQATAPRRLVLLDACRERLKPGPRSDGAPPDAQSAMGAAFAEAIAAAKGQVVLSGTTLGGYSYDDMTRGNGVFTGAILDGLRGGAPADERHFITPQTLADYVDARVLQWVRDNRPEHQGKSRGISRQIEGSMARVPLAIDPGGMRGKEQARQKAALRKLSDNMGGPIITGLLYHLVAEALAGPLPPDLRAELLAELEALDGSDRLKRSLAYWVGQHRGQLSQGAPAPDPVAAVTSPTPRPQTYRLTVRATPADSTIRILNVQPRYFPGMKLKPGEYEVLVERRDYESARQWVVIDDADVAVDIALARARREPRERLDLTMVPVDGGRFTMGCQKGRDGICVPQEKPAHEVQVRSFEIGKYEVTQALWEEVMGENPSPFDCPACPVGGVNWNDVQAFIRTLNGRTGEQYRLPTEAEWEYAARGGRHSQSYEFAGAGKKTLSSVASLRSDAKGRRIHPVGQKQANELGLHDMSGNAMEWVQDCWNANYNTAPRDGRAQEQGDCGRRVVRSAAPGFSKSLFHKS